MIHLEGMGVIGCYIAHRLFAAGVGFTWHDTGSPVTAWRACTGAIFPTGHADDELARAQWLDHLDDPHFADYLEAADYVFCTKAPPHGGRYRFEALVGEVKLADQLSLHLNAQEWVPWTREKFDGMRTAQPRPHGPSVIVTHGFGERLDRYMWGWTVPVRIRTTAQGAHRRPSVYFRRGRFTMAYAYPIPRTDLWYAGSSLISQRRPKRLTIGGKFARWADDFWRLGEGFITDIEVVGQPVEGWRPVPAKGDDALVRRLPDGALACRPLWHSGVRHAPLIYNALTEAIA